MVGAFGCQWMVSEVTFNCLFDMRALPTWPLPGGLYQGPELVGCPLTYGFTGHSFISLHSSGHAKDGGFGMCAGKYHGT